jgi:hypothetical protein
MINDNKNNQHNMTNKNPLPHGMERGGSKQQNSHQQYNQQLHHQQHQQQQKKHNKTVMNFCLDPRTDSTLVYSQRLEGRNQKP